MWIGVKYKFIRFLKVWSAEIDLISTFHIKIAQQIGFRLGGFEDYKVHQSEHSNSRFCLNREQS